MAGMEQLEIHSKDYLVRWINAKPDNTISWTVQPHKRSINVGLFKHPGHLGGLTHYPSVGGLPNLNLSSNRSDDEAEETRPEVVDKLRGIGLKQVIKLGKYEADKNTQGRYEIPPGEAGNYALVFDNTFSKNVSKTVTIFLLTYPTNCQSQIRFGAQIHHSQAMASAMALAPPLTARKSPKLRARGKESADSLKAAAKTQALSPVVTRSDSIQETNESSTMHNGVLQKRRRKKHQGYARRFFSLDYTTSTLSYYHDRNSSALRGAIPLALAAIGANARTREISIDSGAEIWHLKASNKADFDDWKKALEIASRNMIEATTPGESLMLRTDNISAAEPSNVEGQDWARLEALLSKIVGTRDSARRLCLETLSKPLPSPSFGPESMATTPTDGPAEDYFGTEQKRSFWKRKPSSPSPQNSGIFKRSISSSLAVPSPGAAEQMNSSGSTLFLTPTATRAPSRREEGMSDHMNALLKDLDAVVAEFNHLLIEHKQKRMSSIPRSAMSRMSLRSVESQEFFDAADASSKLLDIADASDEERKTDVDSESSSEIDDSESYVAVNRAFRSGSVSSMLPAKAKSLAPLPLNSVKRRDTVNPPTIMPPSLIGFLRKNVGKDLSTISMPVSANEPLSLLQRASESLEYARLLDTAASSDSSPERLLHVAAFVVSQLSNSRVKERSIRKPFNPMLGETFELVREDLNFRFLAEKVSHRPVQLAYHAEGNDWIYAQSPLPSQKFWGKSSEIITEGKARLVLHASGECYSWTSPTCFLRNIIAGEKYVEPVGSTTIINETTGSKAVITFKAKGMFGGRSDEVEVDLFDESGTELSQGLTGTWTQSLDIKEDGKANQARNIWTAGPLVAKAEKHYGMTAFAATLNEITEIENGKLPATDSRLRSDQRALENGDHDRAEELKHQIEEGQRARRKEMETNGEEWKPRWFTKVEGNEEVFWKLKTGGSGYWDERNKGDWTGIVDVLRAD